MDWLTARPVAHRGLHDGETAIENTETAFARALDKGFAIECDVQLTADGKAAVFHDYTLERLTTTTGKVIDHTLASLQNARFRSTSDSIQALEDLLEQVASRAALFIEVKSQWDGQDDLLNAVIKALTGYGGPAAVMSFDPSVIAALRTKAPHVTRGIVADPTEDTNPYWAHLTSRQRLSMRHMLHFHETRPHFIAYDIRALPATAPLAAESQWGLPLLSWTVRSDADEERAEAHVDQIIFEKIAPKSTWYA